MSLRDASGKAARLVGAVGDATEELNGGDPSGRAALLAGGAPDGAGDGAVLGRANWVAEEVMWTWDVATGAATFSPSMHALFGYSQDAINGTYAWWDERLHPEDVLEIRHELALYLAGSADEWVGTYRFLRADGSYVWVRDHAFLDRGGAPDARRVFGTMRPLAEVDPAGARRDRREQVRLPLRQTQVLELVRAGHTNKEIASQLGITEQSVKEHVSRLLKRFGASNRVGLTVAASSVEIMRDRRSHRIAALGRPGLFAVVLGPEHTIAGASPTILALTPDRAPLGRPLRAAYPELAGQGVFELFDAVYSAGRSVHSERFVARFFRAGAFESVVVDLHLEPIRGPGGQLNGVFAYATEVPAVGRPAGTIEAALRAQLDSLETLPIGAVLADAGGHVMAMNSHARALLGAAIADGRPMPEHATEYGLRDPRTGRPLDPSETAIARALRGEIVTLVDFLVRPPGHSHDHRLRTSALPIPGLAGIVGVLLTFADVGDPEAAASG